MGGDGLMISNLGITPTEMYTIVPMRKLLPGVS